MIKILKGNLLDVKHGIIGHSTNCMGKMGLALQSKLKKSILKLLKPILT